jgi:hypothetical protein
MAGHAHGANQHRAWANAVVNGLFAPIPRLFAAGAAVFRGNGEGSRVTAVHGWEEVRSELGKLVVEARMPAPGDVRSGSPEGDGLVILRAATTAEVEAGLEQLAARVRVEVG